MNNNQRANKIAINKYRKELKEMLGEVSEIDIKVLNKAVNIGKADVKENTPVDTGYMKKQWHTTHAQKTTRGVEKKLYNVMEYSSYVNYGHRIVKNHVTIGFVKGKFMLERAIARVDDTMNLEFKKEVERVNKKYGK